MLTKNEWKRRRARLDAALTFIALASAWIIWKDSDSAVAEAAITVLIPSGVMLIGTYVFGAAWDDKNYMDSVTKLGKSEAYAHDAYTPYQYTPPLEKP